MSILRFDFRLSLRGAKRRSNPVARDCFAPLAMTLIGTAMMNNMSKYLLRTILSGWIIVAFFPGFAQAQKGEFEDELGLIVQEYEGLKEELAKSRAEYRRLQDECAAKAKDFEARSRDLGQLQTSKLSLEAKLKESLTHQSACHSQSKA